MAFGCDTLVRVGNGSKRIADIVVGDILFDQDNMPVQCTAVSDPEESNLVEVEYMAFDKNVTTASYECTPDHLNKLVACNIVVTKGKGKEKARTVKWYTRCNRNYDRDEVGQIYIDSVINKVCSNLGQDSTLDNALKMVETLIDECYGDRDDQDAGVGTRLRPNSKRPNDEFHESCDFYYNNIHNYISTLCEEDRSKGIDFVKEVWRRSIEEFFPDKPAYTTHFDINSDRFNEESVAAVDSRPPYKQPVEDGNYDGSEEDNDNDDYPNQKLSRSTTILASTLPGPITDETVKFVHIRDAELSNEVDDDLSYDEENRNGVFVSEDGRQIYIDQEENYEYSDSSQESFQAYATIDQSFKDRVRYLMCGVNGHECDESDTEEDNVPHKKGFFVTSRAFKSVEQANLAVDLLKHESTCHIVDPLIIRDYDSFLLTAGEYETTCLEKRLKTMHLKLVRCPVELNARVPYTPPSTDSTNLPLEPYYLGLFLGDGSVADGSITSADAEVAVWLQEYVNRLNETRPNNTALLHLKRYPLTAPGNINDILIGSTQYAFRITSTLNGSDQWNPIRDALDALQLSKTLKRDRPYKSIPDMYMNADRESKLALIAGLLESGGGRFAKAGNHYSFAQTGEIHRRLVCDLEALANSCGITTNPFYYWQREQSVRNGPLVQKFNVNLTGPNCFDFQKYLLLERKKMHLNYKSTELKSIKQIKRKTTAGLVRSIQVSGRYFQLKDRLVVHC